MERKKGIQVLGINILYLVVALMLLTVGAFVQYRDVRIGLVITEYVLVLLPVIVFLKIKGESIKDMLRLNPLRAKHGALIMLITLFSYPVALFFNLIAMTIMSNFGKLEQLPVPVADNFKDYIILMLIISVSAGICEEVFFRGLMMRGYERLGKANAIVLSSVLFGVFHFNLQNLLGPIVLGLIFGYLVYQTDSLYAGIIGHMTNNGFAVTLGYGLMQLQKILGNAVDASAQAMPNTMQLMMATFVVGFFAVLGGTAAFLLLRIIIKDTKEGNERNRVEETLDDEDLEEQSPVEKVSVASFTPVFITLIIFVILGYLQIQQLGA
ncbi:CPBP family glutamic-type intramembrane protease [Anaerosolibacter sp.]|uniref:CPBP family glutamic-type intramembrane protease n=1 Tax=Anaerosolibacter sp. TaxID=1872527 RepID=UPI0039EF9690